MSPALAGGFLTTAPPGKSSFSILKGTLAALTSWAGQGFMKFFVKGCAQHVLCQ